MSLSLTARCLRWWGHLSWVPLGVRYRVLHRLANPDTTPPTPFECRFAGLVYEGDLASYIDWNVYYLGAYEPDVLAFLARAAAVAGDGAVYVDIGANVGQHSLFMATRCARVIAFEPWAQVRERLAANLARNRITNVEVRAEALGDEPGELPFYAPDSANLGTGSFVADVNLNRASGHLPVVTGDAALAALARVDVIKIDTEGFEVKVVRGLAQTLARHRPVVLFEVTRPVADALGGQDGLETALAALFGPGWSIRRLEARGAGYRLRPFCYGGGCEQAVAVALPPGSTLA